MKSVWPENVIIWGAGATKSMKLLTTDDLANAITEIFDFHFESSEEIDFNKIFGSNQVIHEELKVGFNELLGLIKSGDIASNQVDKDIKKQFNYHYDLDALILIARCVSREFNTCSRRKTKINLQELFTLLDQLIDNSGGLKVSSQERPFLETHNIIGARNCLKLLIEELQRIAVQWDKPGRMNDEFTIYYHVAKILADLMEEEAIKFAESFDEKDRREFYLFSYATISFNWDPVILWAIFNAHREKNRSPKFVRIGDKEVPVKLFNDLGATIATRKVDSSKNEIWYSANETQAIRINDQEYPSRAMRVGKILYPHGIFGSRVCPQCGKMIISFGSKWDGFSSEPFGPSIIDKLQKDWRYLKDKHGQFIETHGEIECLYCGQITNPYDMPLEMQTVIKKRSIAPLEEIKKDMGLLIKNAKHIILAGYSLPVDDVAEKTFIMSSLSGSDIENIKCTIVQFFKNYKDYPEWLEGDTIIDFIKENPNCQATIAIRNALSIFEIKNTRVSLRGIPGVFIAEDGNVERQKVINVIYNGVFPVERS